MRLGQHEDKLNSRTIWISNIKNIENKNLWFPFHHILLSLYETSRMYVDRMYYRYKKINKFILNRTENRNITISI